MPFLYLSPSFVFCVVLNAFLRSNKSNCVRFTYSLTRNSLKEVDTHRSCTILDLFTLIWQGLENMWKPWKIHEIPLSFPFAQPVDQLPFKLLKFREFRCCRLPCFPGLAASKEGTHLSQLRRGHPISTTDLL